MSVTAFQRLPYKPTKPYIHPERKQERKRPMTIALGIHTPNGIVLCSDSQLTVPQQMKYYDQKIRAFWNGEDWSLALTYSGDPERMQRICESMEKSLHSSSQIDELYIKEQFEQALSNVRSSIIEPAYENIDVLCAFARKRTDQEEHAWSSKGLHLFAGKNGVITEPTEEFQILGVGNSPLIRHLENLMSAFGQSYVEYEAALVIGAYLVGQATKYVDGCGGDLQTCVLRRGYKPIWPLNPLERSRLLDLSETLEAILQKTVVCSLNAEMECVDFEKGKDWENSLLNAVDDLRKKLRQLNRDLWQ